MDEVYCGVPSRLVLRSRSPAQGLSRTPLKGECARREAALARLKGVVFKLPERHPKIGLPAIRAFYHIDRIDSPTAARLAKHIITGYFRDNLDTAARPNGTYV